MENKHLPQQKENVLEIRNKIEQWETLEFND